MCRCIRRWQQKIDGTKIVQDRSRKGRCSLNGDSSIVGQKATNAEVSRNRIEKVDDRCQLPACHDQKVPTERLEVLRHNEI